MEWTKRACLKDEGRMSGNYSIPKNHVTTTLEVKPPGKKAHAIQIELSKMRRKHSPRKELGRALGK